MSLQRSKSKKQKWYGVKCLFIVYDRKNEDIKGHIERIIIVKEQNPDKAIEYSKKEARQFAEHYGDNNSKFWIDYEGFLDVFSLYTEKIINFTEVYSLLRETELGAHGFWKKYYNDFKKISSNRKKTETYKHFGNINESWYSVKVLLGWNDQERKKIIGHEEQVLLTRARNREEALILSENYIQKKYSQRSYLIANKTISIVLEYCIDIYKLSLQKIVSGTVVYCNLREKKLERNIFLDRYYDDGTQCSTPRASARLQRVRKIVL